MNLSEAGALGDPTLAGKQLPSPPPLKPVGACLGTQALGCLDSNNCRQPGSRTESARTAAVSGGASLSGPASTSFFF